MLTKTNGFAPFRFLNRNKLPILMYHRFSRDEEPGKTSLSTFEKHLDYVAKNYQVISMSEAVARLKDGSHLPSRSIVITVDDGYLDFYDIAFPTLKKFRFPVILYLVTGFVDRKCWIWTDKSRFITMSSTESKISIDINGKTIDCKLTGLESRLDLAAAINSELKKLPDAMKEEVLRELAKRLNITIPELPAENFAPVNWDHAQELQQAGVEIGSHSVEHPILTNVDEERLKSELSSSFLAIQNRMQTETVHFCYPNGNAAKRERDAVEDAGYASAVTTEIRLCEDSDDTLMLPRIDAEPELHRFVQATSGFDSLKSKRSFLC